MSRLALVTVTLRAVFIPHSGSAKNLFAPLKTQPPEPHLRKAVVRPVGMAPGLWCRQCERRVRCHEARTCSSLWCKAKLDLIEVESAK